ncbi:MAG: DUF72 domain-containing protein [Bacillati bacterium ANGP1]|uniref:DUF72 domain-containing protein n=1 Tax=Candidatus Segetimicrobium genomatis TaxID=2569760 RepID=A0A537IZW3_9BACT|nr:MAG: DUF72 domain-containing protein [Terrabacteria group bacterium ANGP1]
MTPRAYIGTSGFSYPEWKGSFYPADLPNGEMLRFYGQMFLTVELNNTFYRYPGEDTLAQWAAAVPPEFRFSVKAHRRITHNKRLVDVDGDVAFLFERLRRLGDRLGSILFQLPPSLRFDLSLLESFLASLRPGGQTVLEFRHNSWRNEAVYRLLETHRVALCVAETDEEMQPADVVGPVSYLRLHKSRYADEDLHRWAQWIGQRTGEGRSVFAYFTHEEGAPATEYARTLLGLVASSSQ